MSTYPVSIVFPVMNRTDVLLRSVPSWLVDDHINEIIIVDWSTDIPIFTDPRTQDIMKNPRIRVVRAENETYFLSPSFSINLGVEKATHNHIIKLDIDYELIDQNFIKYLSKILPKLTSGFFITDFHYVPNNESMMGFVIFNKQHFDMVNGYNEIFRGWGYEDLNMYDKLSQVCQKYIISNLGKFIYHIPHDDSMRNANHIDKDTPIMDNEKRNRALALRSEPPRSQYTTLSALYENEKIKYEIVERIK